MKRNILLSFLSLFFTLFLYSNFTIAGNPAEAPSPLNQTRVLVHTISPTTAWNLIQKNRKNPDFVILDVRTPKEFFGGRIPGAINHNFYDISFKQTLAHLDRDKTYLVYCRSGFRSRLTTELMKTMGFKKIYDLKGGFKNWKKSGLPTISGS